MRTNDYQSAIEALKCAVRWNPMGCGYRLDLADLFKVEGNMEEYLAITYSVFERASEAAHLVRAFVNFAGWFEVSEKPRTAAAALRAAQERAQAEYPQQKRLSLGVSAAAGLMLVTVLI